MTSFAAYGRFPVSSSLRLSAYLPLQNGETQMVSPDGATDAPLLASLNFITDGYLTTMQIPLLKGRTLTGPDNPSSAAPVMLINAHLAAKFFPDIDPVGRHIQLFGQSYEIAGVTGDVLLRGAERGALPEVYLPEVRANNFNRSLVVRTNLAPLSLTNAVRAAILATAPAQPVSNVRTYDRIIAERAFARRLMLGLITLFAGIAVALAAIGLFGVIAFSVNSRIRELGIRLALGATQRNIAMLVISGGLKLTVAGVALGLLGGYFLMRFISTFLFGIAATDPFTLAGVTMLLVVIALIACLIPARRASKVDPQVALRAE